MIRRALFLLCVLASPASAQDSTVTLWTREILNSSRLNEQRSIYVATPEGYRAGTNRYPVLVILDASDRPQFNLAIANVAFLGNRGAIPNLIVVGIPNGKDRTHDLTPIAIGALAKDFPTAGGARAFSDFIVDEVLPLVRAKYRTLPGVILAGHSFGGLVALEVAANRPGAFAGVIAMSPALWWNESSGVVAYSDAIARATKRQRLFVTSGGLEADIDKPTVLLSRRLDSLKPAYTAFGHQRYPEATHGLTPAPSLVDGLRFIFEPISVAKLPISTLGPGTDSATAMNAFLESKRRYALGAHDFGLDERFPEMATNQFGYGVLQALKNPAFAVWAFRQNVELYPESANVYDSLGDGLLAMGDTAAAIPQFRRAVDVAVRTNHPVLAESMRKLNALEESRGKTKRQ
ncbi:MAG: alpha/beta hydrolase-fold protein [Gemmatimonadota bacterium]|nr:alpha/beta hydrolase-fold protein [Gemmatimonadota bacterium]